MRVSQYHFHNGEWFPNLPQADPSQLLLAFGCRKQIALPQTRQHLKTAFPEADIIGCTTSGEILSTEVYDDSLVVTALELASTPIKVIRASSDQFDSSFDAGVSLAGSLSKDHLKYVMVISDGQQVNGTELVNGLSRELPETVLITGGMAGDGDRFEETIVWHNDTIEAGDIVICGFYGDTIRIGHGTLGGWNSFGPDRTITKSSGNVLYELDGQPALELYKSYLGEFSEQLPSSALRFPLSLCLHGEDEAVVRTILSIDEDNQSMVFAGDMPEGATAKLMKANFETLIDGANSAANGAMQSLCETSPQLAILISCVGRRLVLSQRVYEELEAVQEVMTDSCPMCGYYSYGEISPLLEGTQCRLHNQTMTITTLSEVANA